MVFDIRRALFHHLQMLHLSFCETQHTASLVNHFVHGAAAVQERQSALAGTLGETFSGIKVVKCFAQEDRERRRFLQRIRENLPHELERTLMGVRMWLFLAGIFAVVYRSVLLWRGTSVMYGTMSLASFVAFTSYRLTLCGDFMQVFFKGREFSFLQERGKNCLAIARDDLHMTSADKIHAVAAIACAKNIITWSEYGWI